jgi:hypothetical protein
VVEQWSIANAASHHSNTPPLHDSPFPVTDNFKTHLTSQLSAIRAAGTYKRERVILTPQGTTIRVADGQPVLNLCANNYLGLAQHP